MGSGMVSFLWGFRHQTCAGKWQRQVSDNKSVVMMAWLRAGEGWVRQGGEEETTTLKREEEEEELKYVMLGLREIIEYEENMCCSF